MKSTKKRCRKLTEKCNAKMHSVVDICLCLYSKNFQPDICFVAAQLPLNQDIDLLQSQFGEYYRQFPAAQSVALIISATNFKRLMSKLAIVSSSSMFVFTGAASFRNGPAENVRVHTVTVKI